MIGAFELQTGVLVERDAVVNTPGVFAANRYDGQIECLRDVCGHVPLLVRWADGGKTRIHPLSHMSFKGYDPCGREAARDAEGEDAVHPM